VQFFTHVILGAPMVLPLALCRVDGFAHAPKLFRDASLTLIRRDGSHRRQGRNPHLIAPNVGWQCPSFCNQQFSFGAGQVNHVAFATIGDIDTVEPLRELPKQADP
jgi:hypothetical protein